MSVRVLKPLDPKAFANLRKTLTMNKTEVRIGVPDAAKEVDGTTIVTVAYANEYGVPSKGIPERPAFRTGIKRGQDDRKRLNRANMIKICQGSQEVDAAYGQLGNMAVGQVKRAMKEGPWVPNKPATIKRKGSSKPLFDTGNYSQSVQYEVVKK